MKKFITTLFGNKTKTVTLRCEKEVEERKPEITTSFHKLANRIAVLPPETLTPTHIEDMLLAPMSKTLEILNVVEKDVDIEMEKIQGTSEKEQKARDEVHLDIDIANKNKAVQYKLGEQDDNAKKYGSEIKSWKPKEWLIGFLTMFDVIVCASVFELLGQTSTLLAYITGIGFGIGLHTYVKTIPAKLKKFAGGSIKKEILYWVLASVPLIIIFIKFALLRKEYTEEMYRLQDMTVHIDYSTFVILNIFIVFTAMLLSRNKPSKEMRDTYNQYKADQKELDEVQAEVSTLQDQKCALPTKLNEKLHTRFGKLRRGKRVCADLINHYHTDWQEAKNIIIAKSGGRLSSILKQVKLPEIENPYNVIEQSETRAYFLPVIIVIGLLLASSCGFNETKAPSLGAMLFDISDTLLVQQQILTMNKQQFQKVFMNTDLTHGFTYVQQCVSNLRFGEKTQKITMPSKPDILHGSERDYRLAKYSFAQKGIKLVQSLQSKNIGCERTHLLFSLHKMLNDINQSNVGQARILACTDWSENSELNFYDPEFQNALENHTDSIYTLLEQKYPLQKISVRKKIEVVILFVSHEKEQDDRFFTLSKLKDFYERHGIAIYIVNNINNISWKY